MRSLVGLPARRCAGTPHQRASLACVAVLLGAALGCGSDAATPDDDAPTQPRRARPQPPPPATAAPAPDVVGGAGVADDAAPVYDPLAAAPTPGPAYRPSRDRKRHIELTLRSTPPGAEAAVDGRVVGRTPVFWRGPMTTEPREFTFVLPDYAMARYRFVPTTAGVVHATLTPIVRDVDAHANESDD